MVHRVKFRSLCMAFLLCVLLLAANLLIPFSREQPSLFIDESDVYKVEVYSVNLEERYTSRFPPEGALFWECTDIPTISQLCDVFSSLFLKEFPYFWLSASEKENAQQLTNLFIYKFFYRSGATLRIAVGESLIRFNSHWCYASCGETYGYMPLSYQLAKIQSEYRSIQELE